MNTFLQKSKFISVISLSSVNIINSIFVSSAVLGILVFFDPFSTSIIILGTSLFFYIVFKIQAIRIAKMAEEVNEKTRFFIDVFTNAVGYLPEIIIYNLRNFYFKVFKNASIRNAQLKSDMASAPMYAKYYFESFIIVFVIILIYFGNLSERSIETNISYFAILAFAAQKCPPLINTFFAPKLSNLLAAKIISFLVLIIVFVKTSASGIFGVIKDVFLINFVFKILIALSLISLEPLFENITGSKIIFLVLILFNDLITALITLAECSIPIFIASGFISFAVNSI